MLSHCYQIAVLLNQRQYASQLLLLLAAAPLPSHPYQWYLVRGRLGALPPCPLRQKKMLLTCVLGITLLPDNSRR